MQPPPPHPTVLGPHSCNAWSPPLFSPFFLFTNNLTLNSPVKTPIPDRNTHPASPPHPTPLPKQQPADTEQGRRTSLEKFTRSVGKSLTGKRLTGLMQSS
ncbi:hypothetical protein JOB18_048130 [Solea senegalensis]|uniref:WH2 domain-containing protein n=1 Tax=Solea senegalensis TaxID=28829 RepID=A0AAV6S2R4_SOLSE|nr:hypothetical protein JOB18_048130 [Solea senegalensis]